MLHVYFCLEYILRSCIDTYLTYLVLEDSPAPTLSSSPPFPTPLAVYKVTSDMGGFIPETELEMQNFMEKIYWENFSG